MIRWRHAASMLLLVVVGLLAVPTAAGPHIDMSPYCVADGSCPSPPPGE